MNSPQVLDHSADGIEEYDNPLPRWWIYLFYASIVFAIGYCIVYPSFWFWNGTSGWTSQKQWETQIVPKKIEVAATSSLQALAQKPEVIEAGKKLFSSNCASCHGLKAEGAIGPCLTDTDWKYGDSDEALLESVRKGRPGGMPAWGTFLKPDQVEAVTAYVHSIGNTTTTQTKLPTTPSPTPAK